MIRWVAAMGLILLSWGCRQGASSYSCKPIETVKNQYAKGFKLIRYPGFTELIIQRTSDGSVIQQLVLYPRGKKVPLGFQQHIPLEIPVKEVAVISTTHAILFQVLGEAQKIAALYDTTLIGNPEIRNRIASGNIKELRVGGAMDMERLLAVHPDVLLVDDFELSGLGGPEKFNALGITTLMLRDFDEPHPLGKAEWIKVAGYLTGHEKESQAWFDALVKKYRQEIWKGAGAKPKVLCNLPWKDVWYLPGGKSYFAQLLNDAGADFFWQKDTLSRALQMDFESVYSQAAKADYWINVNAATDLKNIAEADSRFTHFEAWKKGRVFNNDKRINGTGGFDFWESGAVQPDLILKDLVWILHHPEVAEDSLYYYRKLR